MQFVVLIGDSIRMGYQRFVQEELSGEAKVWGPTQNGGTSANVLAHLDEWVLDRNPDIVHLNCGLHDIARAFDADDYRVSLKEYRENIDQILRTILEKTDAKLIWAMTTPVNEKWHHDRKGFDRFEIDVETYNREAAQIVQHLDVQVNDLFDVVMKAGRDKLLSDDGVHFVGEGYAVLGCAVAEAVRSNLI